MHRAMRLRCLLRPPYWREPTTSAVASSSTGGGALVGRDLVRRLSAPPRPCGERRRRCRFYSSKEGVGSAEAAAAAAAGDGGAGSGGSGSSSSSEQEHARLGERDQQEWLSSERFLSGCNRRDSPFLTKRERFRNEFLRRVVPWDKTGVSWENFPYYVDGNMRLLLSECVASHLQHKNIALEYGSRLQSSSGRILLQSLPGTELYRERFVRALANELRAPLLILDSSALAPYDYGEDCSECDEEDNHANSEDVGSESEVEGEGDEESGESDDEDAVKSMAVLKKLVRCTLEDYVKVSVSVKLPKHVKE